MLSHSQTQQPSQHQIIHSQQTTQQQQQQLGMQQLQQHSHQLPQQPGQQLSMQQQQLLQQSQQQHQGQKQLPQQMQNQQVDTAGSLNGFFTFHAHLSRETDAKYSVAREFEIVNVIDQGRI